MSKSEIALSSYKNKGTWNVRVGYNILLFYLDNKNSHYFKAIAVYTVIYNLY
jgi:hypothetical protein